MARSDHSTTCWGVGGFGVGSPEKISNHFKEFCLFSERTCDVFTLDVMKVFIEFERIFAHSFQFCL